MGIRKTIKRTLSGLLSSKAAPRFELGIKDLQSSALPLGHAAVQGASTPQTDRISEGSGSLLIISNGHGEDLIALRIIEALRNQRPQLTLKVLPLVGTGGSFRTATEQGWVQQIGPSAPLPSGGFSNQSLRGLLADVSPDYPCSPGSNGDACASTDQKSTPSLRGRPATALDGVGFGTPLRLRWHPKK